MADLKAKSANPIEMISGKHESKQCGGHSWLKNVGGGTGNGKYIFLYKEFCFSLGGKIQKQSKLKQ